MATLFFDGDKKRVYEVPVASSFTTDGDGFRVYTPIDIPSAAKDVSFTVFDLWSRWVDYHNLEKWALLALAISGGAFRYTKDGSDIFALPDLRWANDWLFVPADYTHNIVIEGNIYPNLSTGLDFDVTRLTAQGVSPRILFTDRGERSVITAGGASIDAQDVRDAMSLTASNGTVIQAGSIDELLTILTKYETNRWKIDNNKLTIYEDDGVAILKEFNLKDQDGNPTETNPVERDPV